MNNSFDTTEMKKYRVAHASERNFSSPGIGLGTIATIVAIMALCFWIVS